MSVVWLHYINTMGESKIEWLGENRVGKHGFGGCTPMRKLFIDLSRIISPIIKRPMKDDKLQINDMIRFNLIAVNYKKLCIRAY